MILQTIKCDVEGCGCTETEKKENSGFAGGWGHLYGGIFNSETGSEKFYLCPTCKALVMKLLAKGKTFIEENSK